MSHYARYSENNKFLVKMLLLGTLENLLQHVKTMTFCHRML